MTPPTWSWLVEAPLSVPWRRRLEVAAGVVMATGLVIALGEHVRPDAARVAELHGVSLTPPAAPHDLPSEGPTPGQTEAFRRAVAAGNLEAMMRAYRPWMTLASALSMAASSGSEQAVLWLLDRGANPHEDEATHAAPILAADANPRIVRLLHELGVPDPPLDACASANAPNAFARVLAAHPESAKDPKVIYAAAATRSGTTSGKRAIILKLLAAGADPNARWEESVLAGALSAGDGPLAELLLDRGAKVTGDALAAALSNEGVALDALLARPLAPGVTARALTDASQVRVEDLGRLLEVGVDWAFHDGEEDEAIPLLAAVHRGDRAVVRAMIEAGAPVDARTKDGACALAQAIEDAKSERAARRVVELLVAKGAKVNRRFPDGRTPLFAAAEAGDLSVVNFLLDRGARVNELVLDSTALDAAEENTNLAAARTLAAHGGHRGPRHADGR